MFRIFFEDFLIYVVAGLFAGLVALPLFTLIFLGVAWFVTWGDMENVNFGLCRFIAFFASVWIGIMFPVLTHRQIDEAWQRYVNRR